MAYDEKLAERVRQVLGRRRGLEERRMFGGLAFLLAGHMCCGVLGERLIVRVGPDVHEAMLARPHASPMDFTGRPMRGMVYVEPGGLRTKKALQTWVGQGVRFAQALPPKRG